jgi:hypothetical protein
LLDEYRSLWMGVLAIPRYFVGDADRTCRLYEAQIECNPAAANAFPALLSMSMSLTHWSPAHSIGACGVPEGFLVAMTVSIEICIPRST